jgi:acetolactate synthase regulatory subunit
MHVALNGAVMIHSHLIPADAGIIQPMIELARCSKLQRIIIAGSKSRELRSELHRRGFVRVATTASCGLPAGQYDVALVDWRQHSVKALETTLDWLMDFLSPTGVLVVWVDPQEPAGNRKLRSAIENRGFVVEAGTVRERGCAIAAQRREVKPIAKVA